MTRSRVGGGPLSRAKTPEEKAKVRQAFVEAGRRLLAHAPASQISLRSIAAEAGYSAGTIYQYFEDYHALIIAIRENDLTAAASYLEGVEAAAENPIERVRRVAKCSVEYWLSNPERFSVLYAMVKAIEPPSESTSPFGQSAVAMRALNVYYRAVDALFASFETPPLPSRLAADTLIATIYGVILFPRSTPTMRWSDPHQIANLAIDAVIDSWLAAAQREVVSRRKR